MATFSVNQTRQLYVAKALKTPHVVANDEAGSIAVKSDNAKNHLYFEYKGADNLMRSDLIDIKNVLYAKATDADNMAHELKSFTVTLDTNVNGGNPVVGQDYLVRIVFRQYVGMSEEDQYLKYGVVHAYAGMTTSDFYKKLAISLAKNFSREVVPLLKFTLTNSENEAVPVDATTKESALTETYTALVIDEVEQPWRLGIMQLVPVNFTIQLVPITVEGDERIWGIVEETEPVGVIPNGKTIADLEYFCMGERGDIYRGIAFPHNIPTTYLVDPTIKYNMIDIHYAYVGNNEGVQKSEKTITLVVPKVGETNSVSNALTNQIIQSIKTASGIDITPLAV